MNVTSKENYNNINVLKNAEMLFYVAYGILLIRAVLLVSTIKVYLPVESFTFKILPRLIAYSLLTVKICLNDRFTAKQLIFIITFACVILISIYFNRYLNLIDIVALIVGASGIKLKNIVKIYFHLTSVLCVLFIFLSLIGVIENYTTMRDDTIRYAFGNVYATDFAAMVFYLQLCNAYVRNKNYSIITVVFWVVVALLIFRFCDARLDSILIISFAISMYFRAKFPKFFKNCFVKFVLKYGFAVCCIVALLMHICYDPENEILEFINKLISNRLSLGKTVIDDYGFSIFGQNIPMQGNGWSLSWNEELGYYYVDSGFLSVALRYGGLFLAIVIISYVIVVKHEIANGENLLPIIVLFIGITSIIDQHFMELAYSPFIFIISYAISVHCKKEKKSGYILKSNKVA